MAREIPGFYYDEGAGRYFPGADPLKKISKPASLPFNENNFVTGATGRRFASHVLPVNLTNGPLSGETSQRFSRGLFFSDGRGVSYSHQKQAIVSFTLERFPTYSIRELPTSFENEIVYSTHSLHQFFLIASNSGLKLLCKNSLMPAQSVSEAQCHHANSVCITESHCYFASKTHCSSYDIKSQQSIPVFSVQRQVTAIHLHGQNIFLAQRNQNKILDYDLRAPNSCCLQISLPIRSLVNAILVASDERRVFWCTVNGGLAATDRRFPSNCHILFPPSNCAIQPLLHETPEYTLVATTDQSTCLSWYDLYQDSQLIRKQSFGQFSAILDMSYCNATSTTVLLGETKM